MRFTTTKLAHPQIEGFTVLHVAVYGPSQMVKSALSAYDSHGYGIKQEKGYYLFPVVNPGRLQAALSILNDLGGAWMGENSEDFSICA